MKGADIGREPVKDYQQRPIQGGVNLASQGLARVLSRSSTPDCGATQWAISGIFLAYSPHDTPLYERSPACTKAPHQLPIPTLLKSSDRVEATIVDSSTQLGSQPIRL